VIVNGVKKKQGMTGTQVAILKIKKYNRMVVLIMRCLTIV